MIYLDIRGLPDDFQNYDGDDGQDYYDDEADHQPVCVDLTSKISKVNFSSNLEDKYLFKVVSVSFMLS